MPSYSVPISQRVANSGYWLLAPTSVSIPSTVKDHWLLATRPSPQHPLPSPQQVGDSLVIETLGIFRFVSILSSWVGASLVIETLGIFHSVSIPSRRVGDLRCVVMLQALIAGFHPLKAGRRPKYVFHCPSSSRCFHPLKAGRRQGMFYAAEDACRVSIPSRRVRDWDGGRCLRVVQKFPSPQGGSETGNVEAEVIRQYRFPSPQGGSETKGK